MIGYFGLRHSFVIRHSCFGILMALLLNALQEKRCAQKCDQSSSEQDDEIANIKLRAGVILIHQPKGAAKVSKRK